MNIQFSNSNLNKNILKVLLTMKPAAHLLTCSSYAVHAFHVLLGALFLGLIAQVAIPLPWTPVPISLQTFGIALLAITQGKSKAALSVIAYLLQATCGLPVLAGGLSDPLWMIGPRAGYLVGFLVAAYVAAWLLEKNRERHWGWTLAAFSVGELTILSLGAFWLSFYVGAENAMTLGFFPFLMGAISKVVMASTLEKPITNFLKKIAVFD